MAERKGLAPLPANLLRPTTPTPPDDGQAEVLEPVTEPVESGESRGGSRRATASCSSAPTPAAGGW
jgi:hypothetical protein